MGKCQKMSLSFTITESTKENDRHTRDNNKARANWRRDNPAATRYDNVPTEFIGIDGEGVTLPNGRHIYVLLGVGDQQIENPAGLSWDEIFDFLWEQFTELGTKSVAYVGFFLGYDFIQWLKNLPEERARMLLTAEGRAKRKPKDPRRVQPFPVQYGDWEFDILGTKRFKLRKRGSKRWMSICDSGPFFQKSFLSVIDPTDWVYKGCPDCCAKCKEQLCESQKIQIISSQKSLVAAQSPEIMTVKKSQPTAINTVPESQPETGNIVKDVNHECKGIACNKHSVVSQAEYETIAIGKSRRSTATLDSDMRYYNARENEILSRVMSKLNQGFQTLGIHLRPNQWFGPGQAAQAWLEGRAIDSERLAEVTPHAVLEAARMSYFGGWFEIMAHGHMQMFTHEYDINSAYPYIISTLPCLEHGEWVHNDPETDWQTPYTLVYAKVQGSNPYIGTMLHRDAKGNIYRPHKTEGWFWLHEIHAAHKAGLIDGDPEILDQWTYHPCACPAPLREVKDIYALRKQVGKKTPLGIACKLVPNSLYGKFAQSIGDPKFGNPIYASLITAGCRTMILNAIATHPKGAEACVMVATDGVYFTEPHPSLPVSGDLGDWDYEKRKNMTLFKPGVYWDDKTRQAIKRKEKPAFKSRGVSAKDFGSQIAIIDALFMPQHFDKMNSWPTVRFPVDFAMITAVQALQRNNWELAGALIADPTLMQSSRPDSKRQYQWYTDEKRKIFRTHPRVNEPYEPSHPYEKRFGMEDPFSQENSEAAGIMPDGLPGLLLQEALGIK